MDYKGPDNIYWLFSSSAQAIAAFIGFLTAGFYFAIDKLDKQVKNDPTLEEINHSTKLSLFRLLSVLCVLTGFSIACSLLLVYVNGLNYNVKTLSVIGVSLVNLITITWAIIFVIKMINPGNIEKTAKRLIKENSSLFIDKKQQPKDSIKIGDFLERFVALEKIIRDLDRKYELSSFSIDRYRNFTPLNELFNIMYQHKLIDNQILRDLHEVNKVRNLAAHGEIEGVDIRISKMLSELSFKISNLSSI